MAEVNNRAEYESLAFLALKNLAKKKGMKGIYKLKKTGAYRCYHFF